MYECLLLLFSPRLTRGFLWKIGEDDEEPEEEEGWEIVNVGDKVLLSVHRLHLLMSHTSS